MSLGVEVGLGPVNFVLDGDPAPPKDERAQPPPNVYCGQTAKNCKMNLTFVPLGTEVDLSPEDAVLDGYPAPTIQGAQLLRFSAHVYCGQTAGWMKMPLGTEVDSALPAKGAQQPPLFGPCLLWPRRPSQLLLSSCNFI